MSIFAVKQLRISVRRVELSLRYTVETCPWAPVTPYHEIYLEHRVTCAIKKKNNSNLLTWILMKVSGKRKGGRPRTTWRRSVEQELGGLGTTWEKVKDTQGRCKWRNFEPLIGKKEGEEEHVFSINHHLYRREWCKAGILLTRPYNVRHID